MRRCILWIVIILLAGSALGFGLLCGVFLLPTDRMLANVKESAHVFKNEGTYPLLIPGYQGTQLDNFTDALMLNNAITSTDKGVVDSAINVYRAYDGGDNAVSSLLAHLEKGEYEKTGTYSRYWHGYLVTLKPLLMILNYNGVRMVNLLCQALLIVFVLLLIWRKTSLKYALCFAAAGVFLMPVAIPFSLQFSSVLYITLAGTAVMLMFNHKLKAKYGYVYFFLILGMATSYLDYLTYPLITLGIPLIMLIILSSGDGLEQRLKSIVIMSIVWGVGYLGLWAGKWLIGGALTGQDLIKPALDEILQRTSLTEKQNTFTALQVILKNIGIYKNLPMTVFTGVIIVIQAIFIIKRRIALKDMINRAIPFLIIACIPIVWYLVAANHSYVHAWFTFRVLAITAFALFAMLSSCFSLPLKQNRLIDKAADRAMSVLKNERFIELFKFALVGGLSFIVDFGLLYVFERALGLHYLVAAGMSFSVSVVVNYLLCVLWVFEGVDKKNKVAMAAFLISSIIGLGLNELFMWLLVSLADLDSMVAKIVTTVLVMIWNYIAKRKALVSSRKEKAE